MDSGIQISPLLPGLVPEYDCREAAVYVHVSWPDWLDLSGYDRAMAVAHYRIQLMIQAHVEDAAQRKRDADERRRARSSASRR